MAKAFEKFAGEGTNDADYVVAKFGPRDENGRKVRLWVCPYYEVWMNMMRRAAKGGCRRVDAYKDVEVCEEWLRFSTFKMWMERQDWEEKQLDKDLLGNGKLYSPSTCVFIPGHLNTFIANLRYRRSKTGISGIVKTPSGYKVATSGKQGGCYRNIHDAIDACIDLRISLILPEWEEYRGMVINLLERQRNEDHAFADSSDHLETIHKKPSKVVKRPTVAEMIESRKLDREGRVFTTKTGVEYVVEEYNNANDVVIRFSTGTVKTYAWYYVERGLVTHKISASNND